MAIISETQLSNNIANNIDAILVPKLIRATPKSKEQSTLTRNKWALKVKGNFQFELINSRGDLIEYLDKGTKAHIIKAKNKKFLKFPKTARKSPKQAPLPGNQAFEKNGFIFAKMVQHPGFEGLRFIDKIMNDKAMWEKIIKGAFK